MDESFITSALAEQWPIVTVILLTFFRAARSGVVYLREFERKVGEALKAQAAHGARIEAGFEGIAQALRQGVLDLRERTDRHSRGLSALGSEVSLVRGRIDDLERSSSHARVPALPAPLPPVQ